MCFSSLHCWKNQSGEGSSFPIKSLELLPKYLNVLRHWFYHISICYQYIFAEKHPETILMPPSNFTVGYVFFDLKTSPSFLHTWILELRQIVQFWFLLSIILFPDMIFPNPYVHEEISTSHLCLFPSFARVSIVPLNFIAYSSFSDTDSWLKLIIVQPLTSNHWMTFNLTHQSPRRSWRYFPRNTCSSLFYNSFAFSYTLANNELTIVNGIFKLSEIFL